MDDADHARSARRADRGEGRAALRGERSGAQGARAFASCTSGLQLLRESQDVRATPKARETTQTFVRVGPSFSATAVGDRRLRAVHRRARAARRRLGVHPVARHAGQRRRSGRSSPSRSSARKSVEPGRYDLILDPQNLWLTIHESIGHPTELDRAMGYEANYAGTSFVAPPEKMIGKLKYGTAAHEHPGRPHAGRSLARVAWDDEGVAADKWLIIEKGMFKDYQTTREQAAWISQAHRREASRTAARSPTRGTACSSSACRTSRCCRATRTSSLDDIIAATDRGIVIKNRGSWSIDHQRYNFQFSGQAFYEVKGGKITGMLKDVAYQASTPVFWNSMDMIGGPKSYWLGGSFGDGKGEPAQSNSVSHGCPPARFRNVNIVNTGRDELMPKSLFARRRRLPLARRRPRRSPIACSSFAKADETRVNITSGWSGNTRFAGNEITTSGGTTNTSVTVTSTIGKRRASAHDEHRSTTKASQRTVASPSRSRG